MQKRWISRTLIINNNTPNTYYDSQSGQHVPIHNENEVSVYLRGIGDIDATKHGTSGSILTLTEHWMNSNANDMPSSSTDNIYLHIKPELYLSNHHPKESFPKGYNPCFEYKVGNEDDIISTIKHMKTKRDVSIGIFNNNIIINEDPISVAANIADIIDCTTNENENETSIPPYISNILIAPPSTTSTNNNTTIDCNADNLVRLCEELSYLDVPGPTIKSRLIVSTLNNTDVIEECLQIGINKYILDISSDDMNDNDLDDRLIRLKNIVEEEGKELILTDV